MRAEIVQATDVEILKKNLLTVSLQSAKLVVNSWTEVFYLAVLSVLIVYYTGGR
jgi:hypothetical protein